MPVQNFVCGAKNKRTSASPASHFQGERKTRCITFPRPVSYPLHFLTLRAAVDYTNKFGTCRLSGLTVALCLREEPARI